MAIELTPALRDRLQNTLRCLAIDSVNAANSGHPGAPMGMAAMAIELWDRHLRFDPSDPDWPLRDRFILSAGHASALIYGLLHMFGYEMPMGELRNFRQLGSRTPGHPEYGHTPGVEVTTGPLGAGFSNGVGMALAARMTRDQFGVRVGDTWTGPGQHFVYGIVSDGDMMEGISSEAGSLAGHLGLGNLIYLYDDNKITIDGGTDLSFSEDVQMRFEAQKWHVLRCDGNDTEGIAEALKAARAETDRPSLIICRTIIGFGSPSKAGTSGAHGSPLGEEEAKATKRALGWPPEALFLVPDDVRDYLNQCVLAKRIQRREMDNTLSVWQRHHSKQTSIWKACRAKTVPEDLVARLTEGLEKKDAATRKHSHEIINRLAEAVPSLVGGSADLACSNLTNIKSSGAIGVADENGAMYSGRNINFGIREHAMGGIVNGIALDGTFLPFGATFLVFSDYARPGIRLAALMGIRSTFVFTHDSVYVGEDGPTHQPIEHLDSLRIIPGLTVLRPADGIETAMVWAWVAQEAEGPAALALTRQTLPALDRPTDFALEDVWKGAYVLREVDGNAQGTLLATGSEVSLAVAVAERLQGEGISLRVVSMPSTELFDKQPESYRNAVLTSDGAPVIAIEAGMGETLRKYIDDKGMLYGIHRFGASAPGAQVADLLGFTPDKAAAAIREHLG
jgi:transketolase